MRIILGVLMAIHGTAHIVGFLASWPRLVPAGTEYKTTVLMGRVDLGNAGTHALGILWLLTAMAFWLASFAAFVDRPWWMPAALGAALVSLFLSLVALPDSRIGLPVNVAIIVALLIAPRFG